MKDNILYLGVKGSVAAISKEDGCEIWRTKLKGYSFVNLLIDKENIFAHTGGYLFCIDKQNGNILWENGLTGLGYGIATLAIEGSIPQTAAAMHTMEQQRSSNASAGAAGS